MSTNTNICPSPEELLLTSVKKNDEKTIRNLINSNKSLLTKKYPITSKTILSTAYSSSERSVEAKTIQLLIELGADLDGDHEWKPLHLATLNPNTSILQVILENVNKEQLHATVYSNNTLINLIKYLKEEDEKQFCRHVEMLLEAGIDINHTDCNDLSAIFFAAQSGFKLIIKTILEKSPGEVDLDHKDHKGDNARDLIEEKNLYSGILPQPIVKNPKERLFSLMKACKEEQFLQLLEQNPDCCDEDDGTCTLLQYSCKFGLARIARDLLEKGADVNKTTKNEKHNPVELAAERGYFEILQSLMERKGINISSETFCFVVKYSDREKTDQSDFERSAGIILTGLETGRIVLDVNDEDQLENTPLRLSLRYASEDISLRLLKLGASLGTKNKYGFMPIEDITPELLERHLDDCIQKNNNEFKMNYSSLMPVPKVTKDYDPEDFNSNVDISPETKVLAYMSETSELKGLLEHPLIVTYLLMKWEKVKFIFLTNLIFYITFFAVLLTYIFVSYLDSKTDGFSKCLQVILNLLFLVLLLREIFQYFILEQTYFYNLENWIEAVLIVIVGALLYVHSPAKETRKQLAALAILFAAFELVLMVGQHPKLSTYVVMLKTVSINFFKLFLWYLLLIVAFSLSFYILFTESDLPKKNETNEEEDLFKNPGTSFFKTMIMLTGEFDSGSLKFDTYPITSRFIFSIFVFMITIILLNLLNGLAVSDTQAIKNEAELVGHIARTQHIYYIERMFLGNILPTPLIRIIKRVFSCCPFDRNSTYTCLKPLAAKVFLFQYSQKLLDGRNCELNVSATWKVTLESSQIQSKIFLDRDTSNKMKAIIQKRHESEGTAAVGMEKLCEEIAALKSKLQSVECCVKEMKK